MSCGHNLSNNDSTDDPRGQDWQDTVDDNAYVADVDSSDDQVQDVDIEATGPMIRHIVQEPCHAMVPGSIHWDPTGTTGKHTPMDPKTLRMDP